MNQNLDMTPVLKSDNHEINWEFTAPRDGAYRFELELETRNDNKTPYLTLSQKKGELDNPFGPIRKIIKLSSGLREYTFYMPLDKGLNCGTISLLKTGLEPWRPFHASTISLALGSLQTSGEDEVVVLKKVDVSIPDQHAAVPPDYMLIPVTNHCNYSCVMCSHGVPEKKPTLSHFPEPLADRLIDTLDRATASCHIALTGEGEPMLSPLFFRIVNSVANPLVRFHFATNGSLLNDRNNEWIVNSPFTHVNVSLDAATPETYRKIRNAPLQPVIRNLDKLSGAIKASGRSDLRLILNMTLMKENLNETPAFIELAGRFNASVSVNYLNDYDYFHEWLVETPEFRFNYEEQILIHNEIVKGKEVEYQKLAQKAGIPFMIDEVMRPLLGRSPDGALVRPSNGFTDNPPISGCPYLWTGDWRGTFVLHSSGELGACCLQQPLGTATTSLPLEKAIDQVWNGPAGRQTRTDILSGKIPESCHGSNCIFVALQRLWDENFSKNKSVVCGMGSERKRID